MHCFDIALSVGDISDDGIGNQRRNVLRQMLSVHDREDIGDHVEEKIQRTTAALSSVMERYVLGEDAVSYTHLDVYKRQRRSFLKAAPRRFATASSRLQPPLSVCSHG